MNPVSGFRSAVVVSGSVLSLLLAGCAGVTGSGPGSTSPYSATGAVSTFQGKTFGASNPISGAVIDLYAAGGAYESATVVATTQSNSDGSFTFAYDPTNATNNGGRSYNCSANHVTGSTQMYLTSRGGNTANSHSTSGNSAAVMSVALGPCSGLETATGVTINEATTLAMVYSMQQFMNVTSTDVLVGAPASTANGLAQAYQTSQYLATESNGIIVTGPVSNVTTPAGTVGTVTMNVTPESTKMVTLANLLADCVNQSTYDSTATSGPCYTLFHNIVSPTIQTTPQAVVNAVTPQNPIDTTMAAWYLATNPTLSQDNTSTGATRIANLYSATPGATPYGTSGLTAQPTDWTIDIIYKPDSSKCMYTSGATNAPFPFALPSQMAIDANGNIWVSNTGSSNPPAYVEVGSNGTLQACLTASTYANPATLSSTNSTLINPSIVVDKNNNVWYAVEGTVSSGTDTNGGLYEVANGTTTPVLASKTGWSTGFQPFQLLALVDGDVLVASADSETSGGYVSFDYVGAATTGASTTPTSLVAAGGRNYGFDAAYVNGTAAAPFLAVTGTSSIYNLTPSSTAANTWSYSATNKVTTPQAGCTLPQGVASDTSGNIVGTGCVGSASGASEWFKYTPISGSAPAVTFSTQYLGGLNTGGRVSVDGLNHLWAGTELPVSGSTYAFVAMYFNGATSTALSPASGSVSTCTSSGCATNGGFQHANITAPLVDSAIDEAGNVWGLMAGRTVFSTNGLVELVGAAVPVVTPLVNNLQ